MISTLLAIPVMVLLYMLQIGIFSHLELLHGTIDVVLLGVAAWAIHERVTTAWIWALAAGLLGAFLSALPPFVPVVSYLVIVVFARLLMHRFWQILVLTMFAVVFLGTLFQHALSILVLQFDGSPITWAESFSLVTLPSALLNLLLALPVYAIFNDLANWVHPVELEV